MKKICINGISYITPIGVRDILSDQKQYETFIKRMSEKTYDKFYFFDGSSHIKVIISDSTLKSEDLEEVIKQTNKNYQANGKSHVLDVIPFGMFFFNHQTGDDYAYYKEHKKSDCSMLGVSNAHGTGDSYINGKVVSRYYQHADEKIEYQCFPIDGFMAPSGVRTYQYMSENEADGDGAVFLLEKEIRGDMRGLGYPLRKLPADEKYTGTEKIFTTNRLNKRLTNKPETKEETYLSLIYALSDSLIDLVKSINKDESDVIQRMRKAENHTNLAHYIAETYVGYPGLSTRKTTETFTKVKKYIQRI